MNPTRSGAVEARSACDPIARVVTSFIGVDSMTRQDQADMVNINNIYQKTQQGTLSLVAKNPPTFGDFTDVGTYDVVLEAINKAQDAFMALPSDVRKQYNNDPKVYYEETMKDAVSTAEANALAKADAEKAEADAKALADAQALVSKNSQE
ncbi:internal scaffolding protein [Microviridae sp.]|nr:internal scaffolding protein [Microviridae sp.]